MQTQLIKDEFLKVINIANRFVGLRPSIPVLANLLVKASKGNLEISSTNLESSVKLTIPAKTDEDWTLTVPARVLNDFVTSATASDVRLNVDKDNLTVASGEFEATISTIAASEFPNLPAGTEEGVEFEAKQLQEAVSSVAFAASVEEAKPILTGVLIDEEDGQTILVATDGYRLAKKTLAKKYQFSQVVIPAKTLVESLKIAGEMEQSSIKLFVASDQNQLMVSGENLQIATRLLDGAYPKFGQIVPTTFVSKAIVDKNKLVAAIKATAVFARDLGNVIKFEVGGSKLVLNASTAQIGDGKAQVEAETSGEELKVAFNSRYILEGLSNIKSDKIEINFSGTLSPLLLRANGDQSFFYIVMPVKGQG